MVMRENETKSTVPSSKTQVDRALNDHILSLDDVLALEAT
jgi:hypothetical protein